MRISFVQLRLSPSVRLCVTMQIALLVLVIEGAGALLSCSSQTPAGQQSAQKTSWATPLSYMAIESKYISANSFHEGLAAVQTTENPQRWGFIDKEGRLVIPADFWTVGDFSEGLAPVLIGGPHGLWAYIDGQGKIVIGPKYDSADTFENGLAVVGTLQQDDRTRGLAYGVIATNGAAVLSPRCSWVDLHDDGIVCEHWLFRPNEKSFIEYYSREGKKLFELRDAQSMSPFSEGLSGVSTSLSEGRERVINTSGKIVIAKTYDWLGRFDSGVAVAGYGTEGPKDEHGLPQRYFHLGLINRRGEYVTPPVWSSAIPATFEEGLLTVTIGEGNEARSGAVDHRGYFVIPPKYAYLNRFSEGLAAASLDGTHFGFIDRSGVFVIPPQFQDVDEFTNGNAVVLVGSADQKHACIIDVKGRYVVPCLFDEIRRPSEGFAAVTLNKKVGFVRIPERSKTP